MCSMFAGESGLGKSTLVNTLFLHDLYEERNYPSAKGTLYLNRSDLHFCACSFVLMFYARICVGVHVAYNLC